MATREPLLRPGGKSPNDPWIRVGTFDLGTVGVVTALGVFAFLLYAISPQITENMVLLPSSLWSGQVWRFFTWPFAIFPSPMVENNHLVWRAFALAVFYYFGKQLEILTGRKRMVQLLAMLTVVGSITVIIVDFLGLQGSGNYLEGITAIELACFVGFAIEYPGARMFFGISARVMAIVLLALNFLQFVGDRNWSQIFVSLATIGTMGLYLRSINLAVDLPWIPKISFAKSGGGKGASRAKAPKSTGRSSAPAKKSKRSGSLSVVPSLPVNVAPLTPREVDALLEKISTSGMESLTPEERAGLEAASNRMRDKDQ